jgi:hypothetical protein
MGENPRENEVIDLIHKRINELREDFKTHCSNTDARIRHLEESSVKSDVLLEQFVEMQQRQNDTNERLNMTITTLNGTMTNMGESIKALFIKTDKTEVDVIQLQKDAEAIPVLKHRADLNAARIEENESLHKIDLRKIEKKQVEKNWKKPALITGGIAGVLALFATIIKILMDVTELVSKFPK